MNPNIYWESINCNNNIFSWDLYLFSSNENLNIDIIKNNIDRKWDWNKISSNNMIKWRNNLINKKIMNLLLLIFNNKLNYDVIEHIYYIIIQDL